MHKEVFGRFPWLSCHKKSVDASNGEKRDGCFKTLPDDVVVDVLSRLEADQLGRAKTVCRMWRALIATAHFIRVHLQRASPQTVACSMSFKGRAVDTPFLFFLEWGSPEKKPIGGAKLPGLPLNPTVYGFSDLLGCCDGLLIFRLDGGTLPMYAISNPVTRERIILLQQGSICGFFLHPLSNKYRLLSYGGTPNGFRYHVGRAETAARKDVGMFPYRPREQETPSAVKGRLHWMVVGKEGVPAPCSHSIMVFTTEECELRFMPHPGDSCRSGEGHSNMHLAETKGCVYAYAIRDKLMRIWALEDHANWHWVKKCDINLEQDFNRHPASRSVTRFSDYENVQLMDSRDGKSLLFWPRRGLFQYDLRSEKITKVVLNLSRYSVKCRASSMTSRVFVFEFKASLVSTKDVQ